MKKEYDKMDIETLEKFLDKKNIIGFIGATIHKEKWGYKKYKNLKNAGYTVYPINPRYDTIDNDQCFPTLKSLIKFLQKKPDFIITITPPKVTENIVEQCNILGIDKIWMQPGAESEKAIQYCQEHDIEVVHGMCIIVDALQKL